MNWIAKRIKIFKVDFRDYDIPPVISKSFNNMADYIIELEERIKKLETKEENKNESS